MNFFSMRKFTAIAVASAAILSLSGCSGSLGGNTQTSDEVIKIGYVTPQTGPLAPFGEADAFVLDKMATYFEANGVTLADGTKHPVEIISKDTQSDAKRASDVASDLILKDKVSLILVSSTPETTNPVSDQCEANQVVCISTVAPWQAWFFGRNGDPAKPFKYTYHFFWGLDDVLGVYKDIWDSAAPDEKNLAGFFPNDGDGSAWNDAKTGLPPFVTAAGYNLDNPGQFPNGTTDFSAQIAQFKKQNDGILSTIMIPPDFVTFWKQAVQQGYNPKVATVAKAILFPSVLESMGNIGNNLSSEIWWAPTYPYSSSLTGQSSQELADAFESETGKQWTQPIGFAEALFEVANAALSKSADATPDSIATAMKTLKVDTVVGTLDWSTGPVPGVAVSPVVGGQWRLVGDSKYELVIVSNKKHPEIPTSGTVEPIDWPKQ